VMKSARKACNHLSVFVDVIFDVQSMPLFAVPL
jgi:hypothetical protein